MYVRLAFAVAVHVDPEILLVDEVLAVGDEPFQRKCMERIKQFQREGRTIVFVTHGLDQVRQLCDRVIMLEQRRGGGRRHPGRRDPRLPGALHDVQAGQEPEHGDRRLEILTTIVTDGAGRPGTASPRRRPGIEFDVVAEEPTDDWVAGVAINDHLRPASCTAPTPTSWGSSCRRSRAGGGRPLPLPDVHLVEGPYHVTVAVHPQVGPEYHRLDRAVSFKVLTSDRPASALGRRSTCST